jgi:hypothetical protein
VRPVRALELLHGDEDGDGLEGLTETHLVSEDAVHTVLLETEHPVQTLKLVGPERRRGRGGGMGRGLGVGVGCGVMVNFLTSF